MSETMKSYAAAAVSGMSLAGAMAPAAIYCDNSAMMDQILIGQTAVIMKDEWLDEFVQKLQDGLNRLFRRRPRAEAAAA